jgi:hypothetical protein
LSPPINFIRARVARSPRESELMSATNIESILYRSPAEIETLLHSFDSCTLPRAAWTHAAHLTVALWYLLHHPHDVATELIRAGIKRFNHAHGIKTTPTGGYHETLTLFWIHFVRRYLDESKHEESSLVTLANNLLLRYSRSNLPFDYYSRERLFSSEARARWIEPDLESMLK